MPVVAPTDLDDALAALAADPHAQVLAGGTDLMVEVNGGHRRPTSVVAVDRVGELLAVDLGPDEGPVRLGAGLTYTRLMAPPVADRLPALAEAARTVGSPQIRNAGTLGGNLATCSPAGDTLPVLAALDATIELASASGRRTLPIEEFMVGVKRTALAPGELIVAVTVPVLAGWQGYAKVGTRNAMVISVVGACLAVDGRGRTVRLALGAVGPTVIRAREAEAWLASRLDWDAPGRAGGGARPGGGADAGTVPRPRGAAEAATVPTPPGAAEAGRAWTGTGDAEAGRAWTAGGDPEALAAEFGARAAAEARPIDDHRSTAAYRRHAAGVLARRLLGRALRS